MTKSSEIVAKLLGRPGPRRRVRAALLALALFDLLFYLFAIGPLSDSDRERALLVSSFQRQIRERTIQVERLAGVVEKVEKARTDGDQMLGQITLPRRAAFSTMVSELDHSAKKAGVELRDRGYNVEPIEGSDTLGMMTINVGLEGNYENLVRFLNLLDRSPRFLIIESLGASPQQAGTLLNATLKLDAFVREL